MKNKKATTKIIVINNNTEDRILVDLAKGRSALAKKAKNILGDRYIKKFRYYFFKHTNAKDKDIVDDLALMSASKILMQLEKYKPTSAFSTWAFTIAIRVLIDEKRKSASKDVISIEELSTDESGGFLIKDIKAEDPLNALSKSDLFDIVMKEAKDRLDDKAFAIIGLRYEGYSFDEIAQMLEFDSKVTPRVIHLRAKRTLKKTLARQGITSMT